MIVSGTVAKSTDNGSWANAHVVMEPGDTLADRQEAMNELTQRLAQVGAREVFSVNLGPGEFCVFYRGFFDRLDE